MALLLTTDVGEEFVQPSDLVVTIDETGDTSLADPVHPVFGLGACAVLAWNYDQHLAVPWFGIKDRHFRGRQEHLHATDLRKPQSAQLEALNQFFAERRFATLAAVASKQTKNETGLTTYDMVARILVSQIERLIQAIHCTSVVLVAESSAKYNEQFVRFFSTLKFVGDEGAATRFSVSLYFSPKNPAIPSLEIADFVAHTAGQVTRAQLTKLSTASRPDMNAVFGEDSPFAQFIHLQRLERIPLEEVRLGVRVVDA